MELKKELSIEKSIDATWEVLGNQFAQIDLWSSLISKSEVSGEGKIEGLSYSVRKTETTKGPTSQEMTRFDSVNHTLSYKSLTGVPKIIKNVSATWSLSKEDENNTRLNLNLDIETKGLGSLLKPVIRKKLGNLGDVLLDDFKYYVENGEPHPRKVESVGKN